jgi:hypothetical protein
MTPPAAATPAQWARLCHDGGVTGKRVEILYGVPLDRANRYAEMLATMRNVLVEVAGNLDDSDVATTQHYRFLCENGVDVTIRNLTLLPVGSDASFTWQDYVDSLQRQVALGLGPKDYVDNDRVYMTFVDQITNVYPYGGQGSIFNDDRPEPSANYNNIYAKYSMTAYFSARVVAHEVGHNIGAVQHSAPHASGGYHCHEDGDLMCYQDGGSYFQAGGQMTYPCPGAQANLMDCGKDDYYHPGTPAAASYLATHWNTANSGFLTPAEPDTTPPAIVSTAPAAGATLVAGTTSVTAMFSETVYGVDGATFTLRSGAAHVSASVSYEAWARVGRLTPAATLTPGTEYTATLTGGPAAVRDAAGNPLTTVSWSFTTAASVPSVPTAVVVSGDDAALSATIGWGPPASDGGSMVTAYRVSRDGTDAAGAGPSSTMVAASDRSFTFPSLVAGATYQLSVQAVNANGMGASVTLPLTMGGGSTRTVTLVPVADATARQQAPSTASGSSSSLLSDVEEVSGSATRATPYLRFAIPTLAAGESITAAALSVHVTNGTLNGPAVWRTDPGWAESALTWNSGQPARTGTAPIGNFASVPTGRASAPLSGVTGGGELSLQLYAESSDGLAVASRETTSTANLPQLVLTISTTVT